ncbi:MAG: hypothetical protein ACR2HK_09640 [Gemmatimonadales bacterium]
MAQEEQAVSGPTDLHRAPGSAPLVSLPAGAPVETGAIRGEWNEATVEGWITTSSTEPTRRDGYDLIVTPDRGENLRLNPNGTIVGRAREGTLLERVGVKGRWTRVRRKGWIPREAVTQEPAKSARSGQPAAGSQVDSQTPASVVPSGAAAALESAQTARQTTLSAAPEGAAYGTLQGGIPARIVGRSAEWVRVQVDGWVREADLEASDGGALVGVSAAEVRSAPERFVGQTLDWRLQVISVQTADELRAELPAGQPYLLTRGPLPEPGFVYVALAPERAAEFRALPPLHEVVLRVRIRAARTRYLTTPVAELVSVVAGMDGK